MSSQDPPKFDNYAWANSPRNDTHALAAIRGNQGRLYIGLRGRERTTGRTTYVSTEFGADGIQDAIRVLQALLEPTGAPPRAAKAAP